LRGPLNGGAQGGTPITKNWGRFIWDGGTKFSLGRFFLNGASANINF
jgi:hypothetical protein